ncbi:hypothetical protein BDZ89DRAFT_1133173 [Hymenopellis radicata]|nr:hypothetical protein BDZ89DRAFT_1133173 [Hymenopellis radicata]
MKWTPISHFLHALTSPPADDHSIERAKEEALIDIHHPARLLPSELLQEIFTLFVEGTMTPTFEELATGNFVDSRDFHGGPWLLSRVSSRWRSIAFAMARLWTRINLNLDREKHGSHTLCDVLQIPRVKLKYHINIYSQRSDIEHDRILFLIYMKRRDWQSLGLSLPGAAFFGFSRTWCAVYASLRDVRVHIQSPTPEELPVIAPTGQCYILAEAPCLRSLMVNNAVAFRHIFRVQWDLITRFELAGSVERAFQDHFSGAYITSIHELLGKFVHLQYASLHLDGYHHSPGMQSPVQDYENASLRCLTLGTVGARMRDELLLHTDLPSLEILHFADPSSSMEDFPKPLGPRTGDAIRELSIFVSDEDISSLIAFLRSTPNLRTLKIRPMDSQVDVGAVCASILAEDGLVPHLKVLRLRGVKT